MRYRLCITIFVGTLFLIATVHGVTANFSANITTGLAPLTVSFSDTSLDSPTGWAWYFGDENYQMPWTLINRSAEWIARDGHCSVALPDGSIVLMGGCDGPHYRNDVWRSNDGGNTWVRMNSSAGWSARGWFSCVSLPDSSIVIMGGWDGVSPLKNDVWRSTDEGSTWTMVNASAAWSPRSALSSVAMPDGSIILMGGSDGNINCNDTWRSSDKGATWTLINNSAEWAGRNSHSTVLMPDGSIILMGGNIVGGVANDTWRSTDGGSTWMLMNKSSGWSARNAHSSVAMPDGSIVLMGGGIYYNGIWKNDVWRSTNNGTTWSLVNVSAGWSPRFSHTSVILRDSRIILLGGNIGKIGASFQPVNDVWSFQAIGSSEINPVHTFIKPGAFQVTLQVSNTSGFDRRSRNKYIKVFSRQNNITLITPNSGEKWSRSSIHLIRWNYSGNPGSRVRIDLLKGFAFNRIITMNTPIGSVRSGNFSWKIPFNLTPGSDYRIRITSTSNALYKDTSDSYFRINAGMPITMMVPNGGQAWTQGSTQTIRWVYNGNPGSYVKIELLKGSRIIRAISRNSSIGIDGSGWKNWIIPTTQLVGSDYRIRISSLENFQLNDTSNANFTIRAR